MVSRRLQILLIVVVVGMIIGLVEAERNRRDDSSRGSGSSSERAVRRRTPLVNQQTGRRSGLLQSAAWLVYTKRGGCNKVTDFNRETNSSSHLLSLRQPSDRQTLPMEYHDNSVEDRKTNIPQKSNVNTDTQTPERTNNKSSGFSSSDCCSSLGSRVSEHISPIVPATKLPVTGAPPTRSDETSRETQTNRNEAGEKYNSKEEDPKQEVSTEDERDEDMECKEEEAVDDVTTIEDSNVYKTSAEISTSTHVTEVINSNTTKSEPPTTTYRDVSPSVRVIQTEISTSTLVTEAITSNTTKSETPTTTNRDVSPSVRVIPTEISTSTLITEAITSNITKSETPTTTNCDVSPPVRVRRKSSVVFCEADEPKSISKCPCPEKLKLPALPQFPENECNFRKTNTSANPIRVKSNETDERNTSNRTLSIYFTIIVAFLLVSIRS